MPNPLEKYRYIEIQQDKNKQKENNELNSKKCKKNLKQLKSLVNPHSQRRPRSWSLLTKFMSADRLRNDFRGGLCKFHVSALEMKKTKEFRTGRQFHNEIEANLQEPPRTYISFAAFSRF